MKFFVFGWLVVGWVNTVLMLVQQWDARLLTQGIGTLVVLTACWIHLVAVERERDARG